MSLDRFPSKFCLSFFTKNLRFLRCDWLVRTRLIAAQLLQSAWSILRRRRILYTYALIDAVHRQPYARPILRSRFPSFHFAGVSLLSIQQLRRPDCHRGMKRVHVQNYIIFSFFINSIPGSSFSLILRGEENMLLLQNSADTHHVCIDWTYSMPSGFATCYAVRKWMGRCNGMAGHGRELAEEANSLGGYIAVSLFRGWCPVLWSSEMARI